MGAARTRRLCSATALAFLLVALHLRGFAAGPPRGSRTPDGHPDLQGLWNNSTQTPLQRPAALGNKQFYTDEELARLQLHDHDSDALATGDPGTYNQFWWEEGGFLKQTSLIVDPPNGRIPPLTPDGEAPARRVPRPRRQPLRQSGRTKSRRALHYAERAQAAGRLQQQLPDRADTRLHHDLQEMIHEARIIPLDGRPHPPRRSWHYLEIPAAAGTATRSSSRRPTSVERRRTSYNCCGGASDHCRTSRASRSSQRCDHYRYGERFPMFMRPGRSVRCGASTAIYEYACHEGNVGWKHSAWWQGGRTPGHAVRNRQITSTILKSLQSLHPDEFKTWQ